MPKKSNKKAQPGTVKSDPAFTEEEDQLEHQVPLSAAAASKLEKKKARDMGYSSYSGGGSRFSALRSHHDMDESYSSNSNNNSDDDDDGEEEEWLTDHSNDDVDDNSEEWEDCTDDGKASRSSAYSSASRYTTGTSSSYGGDRDYYDDDDDDDYDPQGDDEDDDDGDDVWDQPPPYDESELYAGDIVKIRKSCFRDFTDLAYLPPDVKAWFKTPPSSGGGSGTEIVKGVIRNVDDEWITLDLIRPWAINNRESEVLLLPETKKTEEAADDDRSESKSKKKRNKSTVSSSSVKKRNKKTAKTSSAWISDDEDGGEGQRGEEEDSPAGPRNFFFTVNINRADEILLDLVKRVFPGEVGDVVRSSTRLDGGIATRIYCDLSVSPSPMHTKALGLNLPQPTEVVEPSQNGEQGCDEDTSEELGSEDGVKVISSQKQGGKKSIRVLSVREGGKRGGKKGSRKSGKDASSLKEASPSQEAPCFWSDSSAFLPLLPFVQNAFVQSTKDPKFRGFVEEVYGEVLLRFSDGSIAITHGYGRPLIVERGDFLLDCTMTGEFEMEDQPFELEYLIGKANPDLHFEGVTLFVFPRKIVLKTEANLEKEQRVMHLAAPAQGAVQTVGDAQFNPETDLDHAPLIFNSFQCTGFQLGGFCMSLAMAQSPTLRTNEESLRSSDLLDDDCILEGDHSASVAVTKYAASLRKPKCHFAPLAETEQMDSIQNSRQSILSVEQTSKFYRRLWSNIPTSRDGYKDFINGVFLKYYAPLIVQVRDISTQYNILWQDGSMKKYEGAKCNQFAPSRRNDFPEEEIQGEYLEHFATDLVIPQRALHNRLELAAKSAAADLSHPTNPQPGPRKQKLIHLEAETRRESPPIAASSFKGNLLEPILSGKCSSYDTHLFYPLLETDVVCQDIVERRVDDDCYLLEGLTPNDDPQFVGVLTKKLTLYKGDDVPKVFDHEEEFAVEWFKQRPETLRKLLMKDGKQQGGKTVEGLDEATAGAGGDDPPLPGGENNSNEEALVEFTEDDAQATIEKYQDPNDVLLRQKGRDVGEVVGLLPDTRLRVQWQDGSQSICFRHEVSVIRVPEKDEDDWEDEDTVSEASSAAQPTPSPTNPNTTDDENEAVAATQNTSSGNNETAGSGAGGGAAALVRGVTRSVGAIGAALGWLAGKKKVDKEQQTEQEGSPTTREPDIESLPSPLSTESPETTEGSCSTTTTAGGETVDPIRAATVFQVCPLFSAHLLASTKASTTAAAGEEGDEGDLASFKPINPRHFMKQIKKEWTALKSGLPSASGISCKVSETNTQLLKFAVEGPKHTPYFQGFFCFDVALPSDYPQGPPKVKFHSKGLKINPNLYADGNVCLSLLGTWSGSGNATEEWQPEHSTVLQVILSLQALVLVKEPFYNEAGFESKKGELSARHQSKQYNEKAYLARLDHLMAMASNPSATPPDFVFEFRAHYLKVVPLILARAKKYLAAATNQQSSAVASSGGDNVSKAKKSSKKKQANTSTPSASTGGGDGTMNSDGLVLPLSAAFLCSLETSVICLEAQFSELKPVWEKEAEVFALPDLDSDQDDE